MLQGMTKEYNVVQMHGRQRIPSLTLIGLIPADDRHTGDPKELSDAQVIERILAGNANFFEHLLNRYKNRVVRIVSRHVPGDEIEEVSHTVFIKAFQSLASYKQKSGLEHWLSAIAVRTCCDFWRSRYRSREVVVSSLSEPHQNWLDHVIAEESSVSYAEETNRKEAGEIIDWALNQLPAKDRMVMELIYLQDYSIIEAADLLGWKQTTVKVRAFRSRRKLQKILKGAVKSDSGGI